MAKYGVDTNILIYAHIASLPQHLAVRDYLSTLLNTQDNILVVTPLVLHEFIHVVTDAKRFQPPVLMSEAMAIARLYLCRANVDCLMVDESAVLHAFKLLEKYRLGRNRIADTLFVATLLSNAVTQLITCNTKDFLVFTDLSVIDPITAKLEK